MHLGSQCVIKSLQGFSKVRAASAAPTFQSQKKKGTDLFFTTENKSTENKSAPFLSDFMKTQILTDFQKSIIHNCLLDLRDSSSLNNPSFLPLALDSLLKSKGFGIETSGIYISTDEDPENLPDYLQEGISFEFMDYHLILSFDDATSCIIDWCKKNLSQDNEETLLKAVKLEELLK